MLLQIGREAQAGKRLRLAMRALFHHGPQEGFRIVLRNCRHQQGHAAELLLVEVILHECVGRLLQESIGHFRIGPLQQKAGHRIGLKGRLGLAVGGRQLQQLGHITDRGVLVNEGLGLGGEGVPAFSRSSSI